MSDPVPRGRSAIARVSQPQDAHVVEDWIRRSGDAIADPDPLRSRIVTHVVTRRIRVSEKRRLFASMLASVTLLVGGGFVAKRSEWGRRFGPSVTTAEIENHAVQMSRQTGWSIDWSLVETFRSQRFRR